MDEKFLSEQKNKLLQEEAQLELELADAGKLFNEKTDDWEGTSGEYSTGTEDPNILADRMEETLTNDAIVDELEIRLQNVKKALKKIEEGNYGICEKCGGEIDKERLEANPAALLCASCAQSE